MNYFSTAAPAAFALRAGVSPLAEDERARMLADVRGNPGTTAKIQIQAVTYLQADNAPNRNHVRFGHEALAGIARSFQGAPFLRDHQQTDLLARGGTVVASELVETASGAKAFHQTIELTKRWAVEAALDGTLDRFSIGWRATGPVTCTICGGEFRSGWFGLAPSCDHQVGRSYDVDGTPRVAQAEFSAAEGVEVSAVSVPAVAGTGVDRIRAALAAGVDLSALSMALSANPGAGVDVAAAFEALRAELAGTQERERAARDELKAREVATLMEDAARTGRVIPGSDAERVLREIAMRSLDDVRAILKTAPRITPVGMGLHSASPDPTPRTSTAVPDSQRRINELMGVSDAAWLAYTERQEKNR